MRGLLGWSVPTYRPSQLSWFPSRFFRRRFSLSAPLSPPRAPPCSPLYHRFFSPSTPLIFHSSSSLLVASDRSSSADTRKKCATSDGARGLEKGVKGWPERAGEIHAVKNGRRKRPACSRARARTHTRLCVHIRTHPNFSRHSAQLCHPHVSCGLETPKFRANSTGRKPSLIKPVIS